LQNITANVHSGLCDKKLTQDRRIQ